MKFKLAAAGLILSCISTLAYAQDYACVAAANEERGFPIGFEIRVDRAKVGGQMSLLINGKEKKSWTISAVDSLDGKKADKKPAFEQTLGFFVERDVSGIQATDLGKVSSITLFQATTSNGEEIKVIQFFDEAKRQIGGTFFLSGTATACMPAN